MIHAPAVQIRPTARKTALSLSSSSALSLSCNLFIVAGIVALPRFVESPFDIRIVSRNSARCRYCGRWFRTRLYCTPRKRISKFMALLRTKMEDITARVTSQPCSFLSPGAVGGRLTERCLLIKFIACRLLPEEWPSLCALVFHFHWYSLFHLQPRAKSQGWERIGEYVCKSTYRLWHDNFYRKIFKIFS